MKFLNIIIAILLVGCGSEVASPTIASEPAFTRYYPRYHINEHHYGIQKHLGNSEWVFESHKIDKPECERAEKPSSCRKSQMSFEYVSDWQKGLETKYEFNLKVNKYNLIDPPYFTLIWQDWFDYDPNDSSGNPPMSNVKLKVYNGELHIAVFNNSWQWGYDFYNPYDATDPKASDPDKRPENTLTGSIPIQLNQSYKLTIVVKDGLVLEGGQTIVSVDDVEISNEDYQTKPVTSHKNGSVQIGMYWDKDYNPRLNGCATTNSLTTDLDCKSNSITIENLSVYSRYNF